MIILKRIPLFLLILLLVGACDEGLDGLYEDFRAEAPSICKDYCEDRINCDWAIAAGAEEADAFSAAIRMCTAQCAALSSEGAYVWQKDPAGSYERLYDVHLDGDLLFTGFSCLYNLGAYRCVTPLGTSVSTHRLNPPVKSICERAAECLDAYGVNYSLRWVADSTGLGGTCSRTGTDYVEAIFFE